MSIASIRFLAVLSVSRSTKRTGVHVETLARPLALIAVPRTGNFVALGKGRTAKISAIVWRIDDIPMLMLKQVGDDLGPQDLRELGWKTLPVAKRVQVRAL